jgi:hypothetical protein
MIYFHNNVYKPIFTDSLINFIKWKGKHRFRVTLMEELYTEIG